MNAITADRDYIAQCGWPQGRTPLAHRPQARWAKVAGLKGGLPWHIDHTRGVPDSLAPLTPTTLRNCLWLRR